MSTSLPAISSSEMSSSGADTRPGPVRTSVIARSNCSGVTNPLSNADSRKTDLRFVLLTVLSSLPRGELHIVKNRYEACVKSSSLLGIPTVQALEECISASLDRGSSIHNCEPVSAGLSTSCQTSPDCVWRFR